MSQTFTQDDLRRNVAIYRSEAERARRWAATRRQEAAREDESAKTFDARAAEFEAMLTSPTERGGRA